MSKTIDKLDEVGPEVLSQLGEWVAGGVDLLTEQAPLVAQEIVTRGVASSVFVICIGMALLLAGLVDAWALHINRYELTIKDGTFAGQCSTLGIAGWVASFMLGAVGIVVTAQGVYRLLMIHYAPRLYILEQLQQLV